MQGERIRWRRVFLNRSASCDLLRLRKQMEACDRHDRGMQRLANRARRFRSVGMLVQKCRAGGDVQQHQAAKDSQGLLCEPSVGGRFQTHTKTDTDTTILAA